MGFPINNNFNNQQSRFYTENANLQGNQQANNANNMQTQMKFLASLFAFISQALGSSNNNPAMDHLNKMFQGPQLAQPKVEDYGGFQFKNEGEKTKVDEALKELRAEQAANPGKSVSKKFKIGKYKFKVTLDENGQTKIKKKKKKRGLFGKIGSAFKKIGKGIGKAFKKVGGFIKKALPIVSTIAMFVPGLQPFAIAARVASGVMGVVDGIKNGNIFGAVMSGVGALSGVGGKVGSFFSNISNKATGFLGNAGNTILNKLGGTGTFIKDAFSKGAGLISKGKNWLSTFAGNAGTKVSDFIFGKGSNVLGNLSKTFGGKVGSWLTQNGPDLLKGFANRMGQKATNWITDKAYGLVNKLGNNPIARKVSGFLQSPIGQILMSMFRNNKA